MRGVEEMRAFSLMMDLAFACSTSLRFFEVCYPGWDDAAIRMEPAGPDFLDARDSLTAAIAAMEDRENPGQLTTDFLLGPLLKAAGVVATSLPYDGDAEIRETMGEDHGSRLIEARDWLAKALNVPALTPDALREAADRLGLGTPAGPTRH